MPFNLSISPSQSEFVAKPGATITIAYNLTNNSSEPISLKTSVLSFQPQGYQGEVTYSLPSNTSHQFSLSNADLNLGDRFTLNPNETKQLVLKIKSDNSTSSQDSYFTFFVDQDLTNKIDSLDSESSISAKVGSHILISSSTTQNIPSQLKAVSVHTLPQIKDALLTPIHFSGLIDNPSSYFAKINGTLTITKSGKTIKEFKLKPDNVLANFSREIRCNDGCVLNTPLWPGKYEAKLSIDQTNSSFAITTFFVFPFSIVIPLIFFGLLIRTFLLKRYR